MTNKKQLIIEQALHLFASKGFETTSIQEITDACGISKGSFYLSFKSKDELLVSIFEYFFNKISRRFSDLDALQQVTPREKFHQLLMIQFEEIDRHADFILMQIREQTNPLNKNMTELLAKMQEQHHRILHRTFIDAYGTDIQPYIADLIVMVKGFIHGYIEIILLHRQQLNYHQLSAFIMERIDDLVASILTRQPEPFLTLPMLDKNLLQNVNLNSPKQNLLQDVIVCKSKILDEDLLVTLDVLAEELKKDKPRIPVLKGMLANLAEDDDMHVLQHKLTTYLTQQPE
ncbi:MAG: TetR/AcrR family transcriptional regulator [Paenisporosarcina sp.]